MNLTVVDACNAGVLSFVAIHYAIQWWYSRRDRLFGLFALQCAVWGVFTWTNLFRNNATTVADAQTLLDRSITLGLLGWVCTLQFYALIANRRDLVFRVVLVGMIGVLVVAHQWLPLRGIVVSLKAIDLPLGGTVRIPIRIDEPRLLLQLMYLTVVVIQIYGAVAVVSIWKRGDRTGAILIGLGVVAIQAAIVVGLLADFAGVRLPYIGATPHGFFTLCMSLFLAREYRARTQRIDAADRQLAVIFERAPLGKALLSSEGQILRVNPALCTLFGMTDEELCTRRVQDLVENCELESQQNVEKSFLRKDGTRAWALLAMSKFPDDDGSSTRLIMQMQDITELHAHRDRLEELVATRTHELSETKDLAERANAAKSKFLAHISHEIRTPLGVIMLYAQLLQRYSTLDEDQRKKVGIILSSGKHLLTLLSDVLEMSKIEAGRANLVEERFDLAATLDEIERMFTIQTAPDVTLAIERANLPRSLYADSGKVKQILINLVSNAIKFTERGTIRVTATSRPRDDGQVLVEIIVADTGIGIAPVDVARMFQPFQQLEPGARAGGTGLGLAISRTHARLMRGDLTVESTQGVGTTFTFTFEARGLDSVLKLPRVKTPLPSLPANAKVLIVDDVQHNRDILEELLAKASFETRSAADGPGALALHADWSPDLVLMDLRMPDMDGLEAIRKLRAAGSKAAIGVLTASALAADEPDALANGADFFLRKPYDERELFNQISRVLGERG